MGRFTERKIVVVTRKTRLGELLARYNTIQQAEFYVEHLGSDFSDYLREDAVYKAALSEVHRVAEEIGRLQILNRTYLANYIFSPDDIVVAVGQDGLVANTMKYLDRQPLIAVNPDPARWEGVLLPFRTRDISKILIDVINDNHGFREVTMAMATLNDGQVLYGVNDLFIGQRTHVSARYQIKSGSDFENQSSSGIIVSTGLGSTGWLSSVVAGACRIASTEGPIHTVTDWDSNLLQYTVREPYPSRTTGTNLVFGTVTPKRPLVVTSQMPENGVIFSDGMEADALEFLAGVTATINVAERKGRLVI